jgi:hypothetical protein
VVVAKTALSLSMNRGSLSSKMLNGLRCDRNGCDGGWLRAGDEFEWEVPAGPVRLRVQKVINQPEAAGHYHL